MKVLLGLTVLLIAVDFSCGGCFSVLRTSKIINGVVVIPDYCTDIYDGGRHEPRSVWNTKHCLGCSCGTKTMRCCTRYGRDPQLRGCKTVLDEEECVYKFYRLDDPTKPCL
uniref:Uncharacterized protein n=1 Tax=Salvator merianae TaxID=96440 RepID=A0A8D0DNS8_SALMN